LAEERDFCTLLSEQIIDERNAVKLYQHLLDLFNKEVDLLLKEEPPVYRKISSRVVKDDIEAIRKAEENHSEILEFLRKILCEVRKE